MEEIANSIINGKYAYAVRLIDDYGYELKEIYRYLSNEGYLTYDVAVLGDMIIAQNEKICSNALNSLKLRETIAHDLKHTLGWRNPEEVDEWIEDNIESIENAMWDGYENYLAMEAGLKEGGE